MVVSSFPVSYLSDDFGRDADGDASRRYVAAYDRSGSDDRALPDMDAREDDGPVADPNVVIDVDAFGLKVGPVGGVEGVVQGRDRHPVADVDAVTDVDPRLGPGWS